MAEMIYTEINPNEIEKNTAGLVESIKRDGIKYPPDPLKIQVQSDD